MARRDITMNTPLQTNILTDYLSVQEIETLLNFSEIKKYNKNDVIIDQGETVDGIYVIIKGSAVTNAKLMGQGVAEIDTYKTGNIIGEMSFIERIPSQKSIVATSETHCLFIKQTYFDYLAAFQPLLKFNLLNAIAAQICERIDNMHKKVATLITNSDMASKLTFMGKMIDSFNVPEKITLSDVDLLNIDLIKIWPFRTFTKEEGEQLLAQSTFLKVPKKCKLISGNDKNSGIYIVIFGAARSTIEVDGKVAKLSIVGPERLFISPAFIKRPNNNAIINFISCEKMIVIHISDEGIQYIKEKHIELWYKLFDLICHSLAALEKSVYKLDVRLNTETYR